MIAKFKALPKGVKRAIIVAGIVIPLIAGGIMTEFGDEWIPVSIFICAPIYWVSVFAGIWIYDGFKEDKKCIK